MDLINRNFIKHFESNKIWKENTSCQVHKYLNVWLIKRKEKTDLHDYIFLKQHLKSLTSEFSFSKSSCHTKLKEPTLPYYLPIAGERIIRFILFPKVLVLWEMQQSHPGFELSLSCPFPMMATITPWAPYIIKDKSKKKKWFLKINENKEWNENK